MTDPAVPDLRRLAAEAQWDRDHRDEPGLWPWSAATGQDHAEYLADADAVLAAVLPPLADALSSEAARLRESIGVGAEFGSPGRVVGMQDAADIVRRIAEERAA